MCYTYCLSFLLVLFVFSNGSYGADDFSIWMKVAHNGTGKLYSKDMVLNYKVNDTVKITCSVTNDLDQSSGFQLILNDGDKKSSTTDYQIERFMLLQESDDGVELECYAESSKLATPLTISANLKMIKNASVFGKPNVFKIILMVLGAAMALSIIVLLCFAILRCLKKEKPDEENRLDDIRLETQEIQYAEIDPKTKKRKTEDPVYTEIGLDNVSCDVKDVSVEIDNVENQSDIPNEVFQKTDTPDVETVKRKSSIIVDKQHSDLYAKNADTIRQLVAKFDRHGSTDC